MYSVSAVSILSFQKCCVALMICFNCLAFSALQKLRSDSVRISYFYKSHTYFVFFRRRTNFFAPASFSRYSQRLTYKLCIQPLASLVRRSRVWWRSAPPCFVQILVHTLQPESPTDQHLFVYRVLGRVEATQLLWACNALSNRLRCWGL